MGRFWVLPAGNEGILLAPIPPWAGETLGLVFSQTYQWGTQPKADKTCPRPIPLAELRAAASSTDKSGKHGALPSVARRKPSIPAPHHIVVGHEIGTMPTLLNVVNGLEVEVILQEFCHSAVFWSSLK
jgi:hypothetical protein